jgi:TonB family protein
MVLISKEAVMPSKRVVLCGGVLTAAVLSSGWYAVTAFPLSQSMVPAEVMSGRPGPIEQRAKPITPENPVPRRLHMVPADYPGAAEPAGARGTVVVMVTLDESGRTAETRVTGISLILDDQTGFSFRNRSSADLDRFLETQLRNSTPEQRRSSRAIAIGMMEAARRAVSQWVYAPPADGPLSFPVILTFGPQGVAEMPPPPPPPPPASPGDVGRIGAPPPPPPPPGGPQSRAWNPPDGAIRVGGGVRPPAKIRNVNPQYPPEALEAKVEGVVIIEARIERDGTVGDARVLRSIPLLDDAAVEAVRQWEFRPTWLNGEPVPVIMTVTVNFTLSR